MGRGKRVQFSLRSLFALVTTVAVLLSIWPMLQDYSTLRGLRGSVDRPFINVRDLRGGPSCRQPNEDRIRTAVERVRRRSLERSAVHLMLKTLQHGSREARIHAAMALGQLGASARDAVPALRVALEDDHDVALQAARAIGSIGGGSEDDAGELLAGLFCDQDLNISKRVDAAQALIEIKQTSRLVEMMTDNNRLSLGLQAMFHGFQRPHAADDIPVAVTCLTDALSNKEPSNRQCAAWTLGVIGDGAADSITALRAARKDHCADVRQAATWAITRIGAVPDIR